MVHPLARKLDKLFETVAHADMPVQLADARRIIKELVDVLRPACERIEISGSVRRGKPEVHDAEVVIIPTPDLLPLTDNLIEYGRAQYALYGEKLTKRWGQNYRGLIFGGIKCELFMTNEESWGYQYWLRTGPGEANAFIMGWLGLNWVNAPVRFQEGSGWYSRYWSYDGKSKKWIAPDRQRLRIASEEDLFAILGMPYLPPNERTKGRYKALTNKRNYRWPDYAPYFVVGAQQMDLISTNRITHFFEAKDVDEKAQERETRWAAEREYHCWLKSDRALSWSDWKLKYPRARGEVDQSIRSKN